MIVNYSNIDIFDFFLESREVSLIEFISNFISQEKCLQALSNLKWKNGFECKRCHYHKSFSTKEGYKECNSCHYMETPTSGTLFHNIKFGLPRAFCLTYEVFSSHPNEVNVVDLSRRYKLSIKTTQKFIDRVKAVISFCDEKENMNYSVVNWP